MVMERTTKDEQVDGDVDVVGLRDQPRQASESVDTAEGRRVIVRTTGGT